MNAVTKEDHTLTVVDNPFGSAVVAKPTGMEQALVQREVAEVQTMAVMAKRFPRDPVVAMDRILQACARPTLAEAAVYEYARGGSSVTGPSIRLAEAMAQNWGNLLAGVDIIASDERKSECVAYAWDVETGYRAQKRFTVRHWRDTKNGGYALKDERDIYELCANMGARRMRACILAVIPGDVVEAAVQQCEATLKAKVAITPELLHKLVESFGEFGVTKDMIEKRIQRRIDSITPALVQQLRKIYTSLKDEMSEPKDWFDMTAEAGDGEPGKAASGTAGVKETLRHKRPAAAAKPAASAPASTAPYPSEEIALLAVDSAQDREEALAVVDACRGQAFEVAVLKAVDARFPAEA